MPTQVYECPTEGEFDITLSFNDDVPGAIECPRCGRQSDHVLYAPSAHFARTWNEQANEKRRTPYEQAKSQVWANYDHQRNQLGEYPARPNETALQVAAEQIDKENRGAK